ncbi:MAG: peptidoglycan editing factor PgeF [Sulfurospirillaceae bacterium]|nr:peptidoglycan editing factor PgeF [Sulfurospirillaceae bacterium]
MKYFFTDKFEGVSQGAYDSFNLALHVGDEPSFVVQNRAILSEKIGTENLIFMDQVHKDYVEIIKDKKQKIALQSDAMVTNLNDVALCVMVADCIPILFCDKIKNVIGVAHAGRSGVLLKIANKTMQTMIDEFFCDISDIQVYMGPSIRSCCYEVREDAIKGYEGYMSIKDEKIFLDINRKCIDDMLDFGVIKENIEISSTCTCCNDSYFSYRRDGTTGRFCGVISL